MSSSKSNEVNYSSIDRMNSAYNNMDIMRKQRILCDLSIKIENKIIFVHKVVLASNSAFFLKIFTDEFNKSGIEEINLDDISPNGLELLIDYMYTLKLTINEQNVEDLLLASKTLLFDDVYYECVEFMKGFINTKNCFRFYSIAFSNNVNELIEISLPLILENFQEMINSKEFLSLSFGQILKLVQNKHINASEIKVFESITLWVKHDLENRTIFLPELIESVNMTMIPLSYFIKNIEKEEIIVSHCKNFLYESFKMYAINNTEIQMSAYYSTRRNCINNQLILITPWQVGEFRLEYITTGNESCSTIKYTWESDNSIILKSGKIFCTDYTVTKKNWSARIFNGEKNKWVSLGNFKFVDVGSYFSTLVEFQGFVYIMSSLGHFKSYDIKEKLWLDLESLEDGDAFRYLVVFNELIYCIMNCGVSQYNFTTNTWSSISQSTSSKWYGFTACSLNGFLYVMGGDTKKNTDRKSTMKFNIYTGTWSDIADMKVPRRNAGAVTVNGLIYVFGGINCDSYEIYDPHADRWTLSNNKLTSKEHYRTHAFALNPSVNINPENILDYYLLNSDNNSL